MKFYCLVFNDGDDVTEVDNSQDSEVPDSSQNLEVVDNSQDLVVVDNSQELVDAGGDDHDGHDDGRNAIVLHPCLCI
jgi:hypothetical protein